MAFAISCSLGGFRLRRLSIRSSTNTDLRRDDVGLERLCILFGIILLARSIYNDGDIGGDILARGFSSVLVACQQNKGSFYQYLYTYQLMIDWSRRRRKGFRGGFSCHPTSQVIIGIDPELCMRCLVTRCFRRSWSAFWVSSCWIGICRCRSTDDTTARSIQWLLNHGEGDNVVAFGRREMVRLMKRYNDD